MGVGHVAPHVALVVADGHTAPSTAALTPTTKHAGASGWRRRFSQCVAHHGRRRQRASQRRCGYRQRLVYLPGALRQATAAGKWPPPAPCRRWK